MAYWGNDPVWQSLSGPQRAAAMALLEAETGKNGINVGDAENALGAIINRSEKEGQPLDQHVSRSIYQPIIEDSQRSRLNQIIKSPEFNTLSGIAADRASGSIPDWVNGADHYLAPPSTMLALEAKEPDKYRSWRNWAGYDPNTGQYKNVVLTDSSHHFLNLYGNKGGSAAASLPMNTPIMSMASNNRPAAASTSRQESPAVFPLLAQLFGMGGSSPAMAAGTGAPAAPLAAGAETAPALAGAGAAGSGAPATAPAPSTDAGSLLSGILGGQMPGVNNNQSLSMAQAASQAAGKQAGAATPAIRPMARGPIDISHLQALLASKPILGTGFSNLGHIGMGM